MINCIEEKNTANKKSQKKIGFPIKRGRTCRHPQVPGWGIDGTQLQLEEYPRPHHESVGCSDSIRVWIA